MPISDFTAKLLELEDVIIKDISSSDTEIHDYRTSIIKDIPFMGKKSFLHYSKRRYHCTCCGKHFYESFPLLPKHCRITTRLAFYSIHLLKNRYSVHSAASLLGISDSSVFRHLKDICYPKPSSLPKILSIDEFKGNAFGYRNFSNFRNRIFLALT